MSEPVSNTPATLQNAVAANGNGNPLTVRRYTGVIVQLTGTFTATVNFEGTLDGSTWVAIRGVDLGAGTLATTATATGIWFVPTLNLETFRARVSGYAAGNVTVIARASEAFGLLTT